MGGLVGGIFDLVSGDPAERQRKQFDALSQYQTGVGEGLTTAGAGEELGILSGDPTKIAQVEAPEITAMRQGITQQNLQNANFGNRGGGTNASSQAADAQGRANIIDLTGNLIGSTAGAAVGQGTNLMGEASSNIGSSANLAEKRREQQVGDVSGIASDAASIASAFLSPTPTTDTSQTNDASQSDPYQTLYNAQHADTSGLDSSLPELQYQPIQ